MKRELIHKILTNSEKIQEAQVLEIFRFQYEKNAVYRQFTDALRIDPDRVRSLGDIPFLPIRFFKSHTVTCGHFEPQAVFESSGTTGTVHSRHLIKDLSVYRESFINGFRQFYGDPAGW